MENKEILKFLFELGQLKKVEHEGWRLAGVENPETVTDHSLRAAQIAYVLAKLEKYENPQEVCTMVVFHDIAECRTGDLHNVAKHYVDRDEDKAIKEQLDNLGELGKEIYNLWNTVEEQKTPAGIIAKDADWLEQAITAKEYQEQGIELADQWIENVAKSLQTDSAKNLIKSMENVRSTDWCKELINIDYKKK